MIRKEAVKIIANSVGNNPIVSANGFIEYISKQELQKFLSDSYDLLGKNGLLVFSSRNRLFNVFSNNSYTHSEIKMSNISELIKE